MTRLSIAPLALALLALASCGKSDGGAPTGEKVAAVAAPAGTKWSDKVEVTDLGVRMGNPDAPLKLVEYGSYTCPHCKDFNAESHDPLVNDYVNSGKVSFEYRNFVRDPLDIAVSLIAHCSGPEAFFALSNQLFANQEAMYAQIQAAGEPAQKEAMSAPADQRFVKLAEMTGLVEFAKQRGIAEDKVRACLADTKLAERLAKQTQDGGTKYNLTGTPSFLINDSLVPDTASWSLLKTKLADAGA